MKVIVVGGSAAGIFASLILARGGHEVVLIEGDPLEPSADVESAAMAAFRSSAPQIVQPHIVMAKCRELLMRHLPDVYAESLTAGVAEAPLPTQMPPTLTDTTSRPGDERLTALMTRRSTLDWVLQRTVLSESGVTVLSGTRVLGLLAKKGATPHVMGVRTERDEISADLVVDATGRRSPIDRWLTEIGARTGATLWSECGISYFSRHYRWRSADEIPGLPTTRIVAGLDEFLVGIWAGDNRAMQLAVGPLSKDQRFKAVRHPEVFTRVLRTVPVLAAWVDAMEPITDIFPMAGLHNTLRRLVVDDLPVATGLLAVGDSVCTTNPSLGRGLALALQGAVDLLRVLDAHGEDAHKQALAFDELVGEHVVPHYEAQAVIDYGRLAMLRHTVFGEPVPEPPATSEDRVSYGQIRMAAAVDPIAFRAHWRIQGMISLPEDVYTDAEVVAATREALRHPEDLPTMVQPTRGELVAALNG